MEKINFQNNTAPYINDVNLNLMQDNVENAINNINDIYSLQEIKTNKIWKDGKPIYRKVIEKEFELPASSTVQSYTFNHEISNVDVVTSAYFSDGINRFPYLAISGGITTLNGVSSTQITIRYNNDHWDMRRWCFILEYTKTTD